MQALGAEATRSVCGHGLVDLERAAFSDDARVVLYAEDELALDHFAVYRIPIPEPFQAGNGERHIRVTLAFDPPVRHTHNGAADVGMSFRLIRGCQPDLIFEHYRKRDQDEEPFPDLADRYNCKLSPGPQAREKGAVQRATATFQRGIEAYGDTYFLVVRCDSGWASFWTGSDSPSSSRFGREPKCSSTSESDSQFVCWPDASWRPRRTRWTSMSSMSVANLNRGVRQHFGGVCFTLGANWRALSHRVGRRHLTG